MTGAARQNDPAASAVELVEHCSLVHCAPAGPLEPEPPPTAPPTPPTGTAHTQTLNNHNFYPVTAQHGWNMLWCSCGVLPAAALFLVPHTRSYSRSSLCRECSSCLLSANCCWSKLTSCCRLNTHHQFHSCAHLTHEFQSQQSEIASRSIETTFFT